MSNVVPEALRKYLRQLAESGLSLQGLTSELDRHRQKLRGEQYDELWLYCWALQKSLGVSEDAHRPAQASL